MKILSNYRDGLQKFIKLYRLNSNALETIKTKFLIKGTFRRSWQKRDVLTSKMKMLSCTINISVIL